jgi:molecular chaperone IbpA
MAVAGFAQDELDIIQQENTLLVSGKARDEQKPQAFLHHGIARRAFERRFQLADHIKVKDASLANGLLSIDLLREVPEASKPRKIEIAGNQNGVKSIEQKAA